MAIAKGVNKRVAVKKETTWGTPAGASGAKYLRRVTTGFNLKKETYESNEIRTDYQVADYRHGVRSAEGTLSGELSPGSYADFMAAVVAKDFATVSAITALTLSIAASGTLYTVTRSAGDWIVDGVRVGDVIALSGGSLNVANVGNNIVVVSMTSTVLTVLCTSSTALFVQAGVAGCTATIRGKTTLAPLTGHTDDSFTFEEWYSDITQSEVYTGNKVGSMAVKLPATGLVTVDFNFMGKNAARDTTTLLPGTAVESQTYDIHSGSTGPACYIWVDNAPLVGTYIQSASLTYDNSLRAQEAVCELGAIGIGSGTISLTGTLEVYFANGSLFDKMVSNTNISFVLSTLDNAGNGYVITVPKANISNLTTQAGGKDQDMILSIEFTGLRDNTNADSTLRQVIFIDRVGAAVV